MVPSGEYRGMDREEAIGLLKGGEQGVAKWNRRREFGGSIPELEDADLRKADLNWADLRNANLSEARCHSTIFGDVDLSDVTEGPTGVASGPMSAETALMP